MEKLKLEVRIGMLKGNGKDNAKIVKKLERKLRRLSK